MYKATLLHCYDNKMDHSERTEDTRYWWTPVWWSGSRHWLVPISWVQHQHPPSSPPAPWWDCLLWTGVGPSDSAAGRVSGEQSLGAASWGSTDSSNSSRTSCACRQQQNIKLNLPHCTVLAVLYLMEATGNNALFLSRGPQYIGLR